MRYRSRACRSEVPAIPSRAIQRAIAIASSQPRVPMTPTEVHEDGSVLLCAAACVAVAGFEEAFGAPARDALVSKLFETGDRTLLPKAFNALGWDARSCEAMQAFNDSRPAGSRKMDVIHHLAAMSPR